jgi:HAMP domain-containing protein
LRKEASSKPFINLLNATHKISKGDFKVDIHSTTQDEVGLLTDHFVQMGKGLQEREKVKDALGRFVNPAIVQWEDTNYKQPLARRDTVRSDESSLAIITLVDGTRNFLFRSYSVL